MAGVPPKRGEAYTFYVMLTSQADTNIFQVNPTLAAGDVTVSLDGGAFNNLAALPTVSPAGGKQVEVVLSIAEMTPAVGGSSTVQFNDQAGGEWQDLFIELKPVVTPIDELIAGVWSYATRTLTSFGTLVASIWSYSTRTLSMGMAAMLRAMRRNGEIEIWRGDTYSEDGFRLGDISARTNLWFTVKADRANADTAAVIMIDENNGLLYINGAAATVPGNGSITVVDATTGAVTVRLEAVEAAKLPTTGKFRYDFQMETATDIITLTDAACCITGDITRATS